MRNPRFSSPWLSLYRSRMDCAFITTMGFDVVTFDRILEGGFKETWETLAIPRTDTASAGQPCLGAHSLDAGGALGLALHFLNSTMHEISLQQIFALIPSTISRYLDFALSILQTVLRHIPKAQIKWPTADQMAEYAEIIGRRHHKLSEHNGGLNCPIATVEDHELENASYNGWLHSHACSNVLLFSPQGEVLAAHINAPGSWHDSRITQPIYQQLCDDTDDGYYLVADTAFPRGTPVKSGQRLPSDPDEREELLCFNHELLSYRQTAEWGMHALQGSFGRLHLPLDANNHDARERTLEICIWLHQLRTCCVGINQIQNVYEPIWREADGHDLWEGFETMVFGEVQNHDRVSAFHIVAMEENEGEGDDESN
ncbi:hypothetical protein K439DRAFT_1646845 [Ramaria rubella]|nr:hypothetical protein K439DRAFT_1646845 [Ramaria rubella]